MSLVVKKPQATWLDKSSIRHAKNGNLVVTLRGLAETPAQRGLYNAKLQMNM